MQDEQSHEREAKDSQGNIVAVKKKELIRGEPLVFGSDHFIVGLPIFNIPKDTTKVRLRLRNNSFAWAFVKSATSIRQFALRRSKYGDSFGLELVHEQGSNNRRAS